MKRNKSFSEMSCKGRAKFLYERNKPFNNGVLTLPVDSDEAISLAFHPYNKDNGLLIRIEASIPRVSGLRRSDKRAKFAHELYCNMMAKGLIIST